MTRGRQADAPHKIPPKGWKDIALRVKDEIATDHVGLIAAGVAFYGLMALFPAITALLAIGGLMIEPSQIVDQISQLEGVVPDEVMEIVIGQATQVAGSREGGLGLAAVAGILIALYSASKGMNSLIEGMNVAYDEEERRGFFMKTFVTLVLTLFLIAGLLMGLLATLAVPSVIALIDAGPVTEILGTLLVWGVLLLTTMAGLAVLYRYGPSRDKPEFLWASPGAIAACVLWLAGSAGFAFYVGNFGSYNESFGALAGVVVLLMWLWISAFIVLLGAEINAEVEAQTAYDTTVGPAEPMGQRGAVKADKLGAAQDT
ncbi:YihY/virulence factor BrkB family protein [Leisingera caerulea]|uniref:YihY/virulence factor BrkB family protein n=1 Tax=Leisingera caerulea TaxID=506591 RepID=A0ABY5WUA4_LEICA|nr:YihY/virulence factor BrkB family protein [Leisingera caerulea]UWQ49192.1 YihY/virulence factor BrkB family protein [Leisingera caerulea]UWQ57907.1 YihY/virulence factor BrkB family protein [Leisingera caerulea]UWQ62090.1 YihY/virulence factor BrkB family protein [Leisingera caerulea]UWQ82938.1 YihY/virulence factor BrkB family protein [Leisingera caerulea]